MPLEPAPAEELAPLPDGPVDDPPPAEDPSVAAAPPEATAEAAEDDDDVAGAMVPVGVVKGLRRELQETKRLAERAGALEQQVNQFKPYADFLSAHPHLLQPQAPAAPATPAADTAAQKYAEKLQLYTRDGSLDVPKAREILNDHDAAAQRAAERVMQPVSLELAQNKAATNVQNLLNLKDADGRPLDRQYLEQTIGAITNGMPREKALQVLSDPQVVNVIGMTALGMQASQKKSAPKPPEADPLFRESAGGASGFTMTEDERRFAKTAKMSDKDYATRAAKYKPGISLEME